jgi:vacuolar-type H+-ATPase subunit E/Vma4
MTPDDTMGPVGRGDPLAPLAAALLQRAREEADTLLSDADARAGAALAEARATAEGILAEARARGRADADAVLSAARARADRRARAIVLAAQREALDSARLAARRAVRGLRDEPDWPELREGLRRRAHEQLGPDAVLTDLPDGGLVATAGGRRLDLSLDALADDVVAGLGADPAELWQP